MRKLGVGAAGVVQGLRSVCGLRVAVATLPAKSWPPYGWPVLLRPVMDPENTRRNNIAAHLARSVSERGEKDGVVRIMDYSRLGMDGSFLRDQNRWWWCCCC